MNAVPFCNACGVRFEDHDRYCASCGAGRFSLLTAASTIPTPVNSAPSSAETLFPGYAPASWSASRTVLTDEAGRIAIYAVSKADAHAALLDLGHRKRFLSLDEDGQTIGHIETAMQRLDQLIRVSEQGQP